MDNMTDKGDWALVPREPTEAMLEAAHYELADRPFRNNAERSERVYAAMLAAAPPSAPVGVEAYNRKQIAWELERTAMGDGFYGNALRVAKDFPEATPEIRSLLDRWATGSQRGLSDRTDLCSFALAVAQQPAAEAQAQDGGEVAYFRKEMIARCRKYAAGMADIGADPRDLEAALAPLLCAATSNTPVGVEALVERWRTKKHGLSALGCANELEHALAQHPAPSVPVGIPPSGVAWRPIETAPKDNKHPLYLAQFDPDTGELIELDWDASWESESESWEIPKVYYIWRSANGRVEEPTHWAYQNTPEPKPALVGVEAMPGIRRELAGIVRRDDGDPVWIEPNEAAAILRALAQQPAAVDAYKVFHAVSAYVSPADRSHFRKALEQALAAACSQQFHDPLR